MSITGTAALAAVRKVTVEQRVAEYIRCREVLAKKKEEYEESIASLVELQQMLTGWLQSFMEENGADNVKTPHGTCYSITKFTASLADPEAFMKHVIETKDFDLLDRKANVTAAKAYTAEHGAPPPGVNLSSIKTVGVRRSTGT